MHRRHLVAFAALSTLVVMVGRVPTTPAQNVGGYQPANVADPDVVAAAQFAVREKKASFATVLEAQTQVVAGTNILLVLDVHDGNEVRQARAVVFSGLGKKMGKRHFQLTSWEWTGLARTQEKEVQAADAQLVVYAKGNKVGGAFTHVGKKVWVEDTSDGRHRFTETGRDEWSIFLEVDNGGYTIQIDLWKRQIFITDKDKPQRELYKILKAF